MVGLIFPHLHYQQHDHIFSDHPINNTSNTHNENNNSSNSTPALGVGMGVIPLLSNSNTAQDSQSRETHLNCLKKPVSAIFNTSNTSTGIGTITCRDCGNQAKKDCIHSRCRTCCRSHGFSCSTHVKSTWIPAARRRERQLSSAGGSGGGGVDGLWTTATTGKKARVIALERNSSIYSSHTSTSNTTPRSFDSSSSQQDASFRGSLPSQVQAPAVFKCVRVTATDNGEDEYVYQAVVKIRGHVFKGILYDQGVERRDIGAPHISDLHLGGPGARNNGASPSPLLDHPDIYAASGNGSVEAITYGNTMS